MIYPYRRADVKKMFSIIEGCESDAGIDDIISLGFQRDDFSFSKPVALMKKIIFSNYKPDSVVLDFFAGSGTTGQAVLELNKEDGGNRQFILCVNQEADSDKICYERLRHVLAGTSYDWSKNFAWITKNEAFGNSLEIDEINSCPDNDPDVFKKVNLLLVS